jgi:hypothetical protein
MELVCHSEGRTEIGGFRKDSDADNIKENFANRSFIVNYFPVIVSTINLCVIIACAGENKYIRISVGNPTGK